MWKYRGHYLETTCEKCGYSWCPGVDGNNFCPDCGWDGEKFDERFRKEDSPSRKALEDIVDSMIPPLYAFGQYDDFNGNEE